MTKMPLKTAAKTQIPLTRIQKLIAQRMQQAKQQKPCFYIELKADVTDLWAMRPKLRKTLGVKIASNAFYIRSLALAAKKYPLTLGTLDGDMVKIADSINVGFAVNAPQGLVVPVIKSADEKTLAEIAALVTELTNKARSNKLALEDIQGETIAMSNLGVYGIDSFIGIVPPPAGTILAVGNTVRTVCPVNDRPVVRKMVSLNVAVDHRIINGSYAANFLNHIKQYLQSPQQLL